MKSYTIRIQGLKTPDGKIGVTDLIEYLENLKKSTQSALRIHSEGFSKKRGSLPKWIEDATEFVVSPVPTKGSTCLHIEAKTFNEVENNKLNTQTNLFEDTYVSRDDTAFQVLEKTILAIENEDLNSDFIDKGLLDTLYAFKRDSQSLKIYSGDSIHDSLLFGINDNTFEKIEKISKEAPDPQEATITGVLDVIEAKSGLFKLLLGSSTIKGKINLEFMSAEDMRLLWNKKVLVKGTVYFKVSGIPRIIDAKTIVEASCEDDIFEKIPMKQVVADFMRDVPLNYKRVDFDELFGKFETDETDEELFNALNNNG